ncbi:hypothetical protein [Caulobacter sp.]|uniref:hypothetical protein n=1 Tax=Caulobacter sp. TaxID=78 RepID=UPI003BABD8A1
MWSRTTAAATLAALTLAALASPAPAQDFVRADCRDYATANPAVYDTPEHQRWYKRFWTGDCEKLSFCFPGSPNWNDIVAKLVARGGPAERPMLLPKACRLGRLIGLEWSREKKIRRIDTTDLKTFKTMLEASGDALRGVERVEVSAQTKLKR